MDDKSAIEALAALAQPTRLNIFRRLVAAEQPGLPAGEIARHLGVPHNTLSTHLAVLQRASLVSSTREGRTIRYRAELERVRALVAFLTADCCGGRPELCAPLIVDLRSASRSRNQEDSPHGRSN
ncbi:MAG: helix-turn-helix transcriptional regulator [Bauldia sp.]|uniref:ArsR/SmtB family transcription factor n=1 Tax=Bauldia sp. TaxID=2575872 RepID=UPI001D8BA717|nr:metalloregulator ArsR/SmtB family transcription factor [Bauldia sp.]MCB1488907.1 helix-turn-helix transcriptional regulator [Bauldia sp.]MCB1495384.1 helix-turn-helix transcriptional regulator [Bauldia sp.]